MKHPFHVIRYLEVKPRDKKPTDVEVLKAVLSVEQIDEQTKERIRVVLEVLPKIEEGRATIPRDLKRALKILDSQISGQPIESQISLLRDPDVCGELAQDGLSEGVNFAARMLEDGASTIYSPDYAFYQLLNEGQSAVASKKKDDVKDADVLGGVAGGGIGVFVGGVGAGPGAAAGAAGASVGVVIAKVLAWLF